METLKEEVKLLLIEGDIEGAVNKCLNLLKPYNYKDLHLPKIVNINDLKEAMRKDPDEELIKGWIHNSTLDILRLEERQEILKMFICMKTVNLEEIVNHLIYTVREIRDKHHEIMEFESFLKK